MGTFIYNPRGFLTLLNREIHRFTKVSVQTILAPLISNLLYLGIFGGVLSTRDVGIGGVNYLLFLVPGLSTMAAIMASFQNPAFSLIQQKYMNTISDLNSFPISNFEKTLAFILGGTIRGLMVGTLTYGATIPFVGSTIKYPLLFFISLTLTSFIFAGLGLFCGLLLDGFEKMNFVLSIIITPMTYLGGVFFEVTKLPGLLSGIRFINPIYPLVNLTRYGYVGIFEGNILHHGVFVIIFVLIAIVTSTAIFSKGVGIKIN